MRKTIDYMVQHATFLRDQVILLLIRQTGARLSEVLEMTAGGYRNARHAGRALIKNKGSRGCEEKTIHFTTSIDRHLLCYIQIERAKYDPYGRSRLEDLDDRDPLFLTRTGKPYTRSAFYHNWNKLFPLAQSQFKKAEHVEFTPHDLRHLRTTRAITKFRKDAGGDAATEVALLEGFQHLMGWQSPETMATYLKTMNKRQAIKTILEDEEAQEQTERSSLPLSASLSGESEPGPSQKPVLQKETQALLSVSDTDEFDWYEE